MALACPSCAAPLSPGTLACPHDGTPITPAPAPPSPEDPLIGRLLDGRYRIRKELGTGGVGAVYEGEHVEIKRTVAIKVLHAVFARTDSFRKRFEREAQSASRLSHPGCVSVLDFGRVSRIEPADGSDTLIGMPYLVMEFVSGELLYDRIDRGKVPPAQALIIARGLLSALRHAHGLGIVHRDIKPSNIMIASTGETLPLIKLLDFGLAKDLAVEGTDGNEALTMVGTVFGTPRYLSPEQALGQKADARSDLYSVGVVLFEMICGRPPFPSADLQQVVRDHVSTPPPRPSALAPAISPELDALITKALEKRAADRFQTAVELKDALAQCPEGSPTPSQANPVVPARRPAAAFVRAHKGTLLAAAGVAALVAYAVLFALWRAPAPAPAVTAPPAAVRADVPAEPIAASARRHLATAEDYARRIWCADAIEELERALRDDPRLRSDVSVTRAAIPCLRSRTQAKAIRFLVENVGAEAKPELQIAAAGDPKPDVREGAQRALERLAATP